MKKIKSIILAAGKSRRMGTDKALIKINGTPNIVRIIDKMHDFSEEIVVVVSHNYKEIKNILSDCKKINIVINKKAYLGMFSSVKTAVKTVGKADFVFFQPVDSFFIPKEVYDFLMKNLNDNYDFIKPYIETKQGIKGGHPIVITSKGLKKISVADIEDNLKNIMRKSKVKFVRTEYDEILLNINTPEELEKYLKR